MTDKERIQEIRDDYKNAINICDKLNNLAYVQCFKADYNDYMQLEMAINYIPWLLDQVAERDKEIKRLQEAQRWISVNERLPESGKHILLGCEVKPSRGKYVCDGYYAASKAIICGDDPECATEYDDYEDEFYLFEGFYEVIKNWDDFSSIVINDFVTHWMSLPEPPLRKGEGD